MRGLLGDPPPSGPAAPACGTPRRRRPGRSRGRSGPWRCRPRRPPPRRGPAATRPAAPRSRRCPRSRCTRRRRRPCRRRRPRRRRRWRARSSGEADALRAGHAVSGGQLRTKSGRSAKWSPGSTWWSRVATTCWYTTPAVSPTRSVMAAATSAPPPPRGCRPRRSRSERRRRSMRGAWRLSFGGGAVDGLSDVRGLVSSVETPLPAGVHPAVETGADRRPRSARGPRPHALGPPRPGCPPGGGGLPGGPPGSTSGRLPVRGPPAARRSAGPACRVPAAVAWQARAVRPAAAGPAGACPVRRARGRRGAASPPGLAAPYATAGPAGDAAPVRRRAPWAGPAHRGTAARPTAAGTRGPPRAGRGPPPAARARPPRPP